MLLLCHPTPSPARQAAVALQEAGLLGEFWTCIPSGPNMLQRLLPERVGRQLLRRTFPAELAARVRAVPLRAIARGKELRATLGRLASGRRSRFCGAAVAQALDRRTSARLAEGRFSGVYAFEHGAHQSFEVAQSRGLARLYDLPAGYWRAARSILREEAELSPEWASTLPSLARASEHGARTDAELVLAEIIFVASTFALKTLDLAPDFSGSVVINPPGTPAPPSSPANPRRDHAGGRLRILFIGSLGQRTGLSYLLDACGQLGSGVELTLIGSRPDAACAPLEAALAQHRWVARCASHHIPEEMRQHDVFVLPSLFEGFGAALLEAMAMGLPVITTPNTAGPDLIEDGVQGFIVPIRSTEQLVEKLDLLRRDPELRKSMGEAARERAADATWENYRQNLAACAGSVLATR